jgi:glycosyltransferase involved in cell wall biosynthesis
MINSELKSKKIFKNKDKLRICLIGSKKPYPAFESVSNILKEILGQSQVIELKINDMMPYSPSFLKAGIYIIQDLLLYFKILRLYKNEKIDIFIFFQGLYPLSSVGIKLLNKKLVHYIGGSHYYWSYLESSSIFGKIIAFSNILLQEICYKSADLLITLSKSMLKTIPIEKYKEKTFFALPRIDKQFYTIFRPINKYSLRKNKVGFVGLLCKRKGILTFIEAIHLISNLRTDIEFLIIGHGPLLKSVEDEVKRYNLSNLVKIKSFVSTEELVKAYNEMKLYVLPSYAEGIPSTVFEAMACGTPVLVTPVGGILDFIKDGENGFVLRSYEAKYLAHKIINILENDDVAEKVSENAYKSVKENFNEEKIRDSWKKIIVYISDMHV